MKGKTDVGAILSEGPMVVSYQLLSPKTIRTSLQNVAIFEMASIYYNCRNYSAIKKSPCRN